MRCGYVRLYSPTPEVEALSYNVLTTILQRPHEKGSFDLQKYLMRNILGDLDFNAEKFQTLLERSHEEMEIQHWRPRGWEQTIK